MKLAETLQNDLYNRLTIQLILLLTILLFFFISCTSRNENRLLLYADSLMTRYPDSVLNFLESIPSPQKLSQGDRALYALLLTQARYKNNRNSKDDSLIKVAVDYYEKMPSIRAAQAYYCWGGISRNKGNLPFAVAAYLKAIELTPDNNDFLAVVYDDLADCYLDQSLYEVAMESYEKSYKLIHEDKEYAYYPLRGMAQVLLLQNQLDSALCYLQKAYDCALASKDSSRLAVLYNDLAEVYIRKKEYVQANELVTRVIEMPISFKSNKVYLLKAQIMLSLNNLDSARYFFEMNKDSLDIYGEAIYYNGLWQLERKKGNWEAAVQDAGVYFVLKDSIQKLSQSHMLNKMINKYQLDKHKRTLTQRGKSVLFIMVVGVFLFLFVGVIIYVIRHKRYEIALRHDSLLNREAIECVLAETSKLVEQNVDVIERFNDKKLKLCLSMFKATDYHEKLHAISIATPKQLKSMRSSVLEMNIVIRETFNDVMVNLKDCCPNLTKDDLFYCVLSLLHCSNIVILELMGTSPDALKMRKCRIKGKMKSNLFEYIFLYDNQ